MKKNKFNIGDKVEVKNSVEYTTIGKVEEIYWDEDLRINCYIISGMFFVHTEKELRKIK